MGRMWFGKCFENAMSREMSFGDGERMQVSWNGGHVIWALVGSHEGLRQLQGCDFERLRTSVRRDGASQVI